MAKEPRWAIYRFIASKVDELLDGKVPAEKLIITKSLKELENYKKPDQMPHVVVSKKMKERGKYVAAGTRIRYLFIKTDNPKDAQYKKAEDPDYQQANPDICQIDYPYYFEKQLIKPIDEVLEVKFGVNKVMTTAFKLMRKGQLKRLTPFVTPKFLITS